MSTKNFETVIMTTKPPRYGDLGAVEEGHFRTENNIVFLVDINGVPWLDQKGKRLEAKLAPGENARRVPTD